MVSSAALMAQAAGAALVTLALMREVEKLGHFIDRPNMSADYLVALLWAAALGVAIWIGPLVKEDRRDLLLLWGARVFVTLVVMLVYEGHYNLDAFYYFRFGAGPLRWVYRGEHNGTVLMLNLVGLHASVLPVSYHATKVSFAIVGLAGVYIFYRAAVMFLGHEDRRILLILGLTPSILFWGSILGKDPLAMFAVAVYSYGVAGICKRRRPSFLLWVVVGVALSTAIRVWMAAIMAIPLLAVVWQLMPSRSVAILFIALCVLFGLSEIRMVMHMMNLFQVATAKELLEQLSKNGQSFDSGGSATRTNLVVKGWSDFVRLAPFGIFSALFRPLPGEVLNPFGLMAGLEDSVVLILALRAAVRLRLSDLRELMIPWALLFLLLWSTLYGFISIHNMGTAVRYRLQVMPLEILLFLYLGRRRSAGSGAFQRSVLTTSP